MRKCLICGDPIKEDERDNAYRTFDGRREIHENCAHDGMEYASTLVCFGPQTISEPERFCTEYSTDCSELPYPIKKQKWVKTDGWRGYTDWEFFKGYAELAGGWVTGYPDDTTERKYKLAEMFEDLESGDFVPPVPIYWIFGHTSNVFSTASAIVAKKSDFPALEKWLLEINGGIDELQEKFN